MTGLISYKTLRRWAVEPGIAASVTVILFLLMAYLITPTGSVPESIEEDLSIQITRTKREETTKRRNRILPKKPEIEKLSSPPIIPRTRPISHSNNQAIDVSLPTSNSGVDKFVHNSDRRATPLVRIPPQYPQSQIRKEQEGWVLVEFTITATGTTANAVVIDSEPKKVFDRVVLQALKRWKYQPKVVGGDAIAQHNMREVFRFEIEDS